MFGELLELLKLLLLLYMLALAFRPFFFVRFDNRTFGWCRFCGGIQLPEWAFPEHPGCAEFKEELQSLQAGELTKDFRLASETVLARSIGEIDPAAEVELKAHEHGPFMFYRAKVSRRRSLIKSAHKE